MSRKLDFQRFWNENVGERSIHFHHLNFTAKCLENKFSDPFETKFTEIGPEKLEIYLILRSISKQRLQRFACETQRQIVNNRVSVLLLFSIAATHLSHSHIVDVRARAERAVLLLLKLLFLFTSDATYRCFVCAPYSLKFCIESNVNVVSSSFIVDRATLVTEEM